MFGPCFLGSRRAPKRPRDPRQVIDPDPVAQPAACQNQIGPVAYQGRRDRDHGRRLILGRVADLRRCGIVFRGKEDRQ